MVRAIVLIGLGGGSNFQETLKLINAVDGVVWAYLTFGPTDVVAQVEAGNLTGITGVVQEILRVQGVEGTDTRIIAD